MCRQNNFPAYNGGGGGPYKEFKELKIKQEAAEQQQAWNQTRWESLSRLVVSYHHGLHTSRYNNTAGGGYTTDPSNGGGGGPSYPLHSMGTAGNQNYIPNIPNIHHPQTGGRA